MVRCCRVSGTGCEGFRLVLPGPLLSESCAGRRSSFLGGNTSSFVADKDSREFDSLLLPLDEVRKIAFWILAGGFAVLLVLGTAIQRFETASTGLHGAVSVAGVEVIQRDSRESSLEIAVRNEGKRATSGTLSFLLDLEVLEEKQTAEETKSACLDRVVKTLCDGLSSDDQLLSEQTIATITSGRGCSHGETYSKICRLEGKVYVSLKAGETRLFRLSADIPNRSKLGGGVAKKLVFIPD